ncbi:hypothetical protein ACFRFH_12005 [Leifsonia sp. NPDC056824]|uniref:hypothetical protein n=1 Tax=Leifsonia sp. NPDC056824 TaxID=3345953 RepID=UPI00367D1AC9
MSVKVSSWVWHDEATSGINGNEMILLLALADVADDNGRCRFVAEEEGLTYDALAVKARVDRRTIERLIPRLRERGLVSHVRGSKVRPNEFAILVPWAQTSTDKVSGNGSDSPTAGTTFPDSGDIGTSLKRIDVIRDDKPRRGSRITEGWKPSEGLIRWARQHCPSVGPVESANFVDYWLARPGQGGLKLDWDATWRTWMRRAHQSNVERGWVPSSQPELVAVPSWVAQLRIPADEYLERRDEVDWVAEMERRAREAS